MLQNEKSLQIGDFIYRMKDNNKIGKFPSMKVGLNYLVNILTRWVRF